MYETGRLNDGDFGTLGLMLDLTQERNYADAQTIVKKYAYTFPAAR